MTKDAMAMDGGSIFLMAVDSSGAAFNLSLDWSLSAQDNRSASLSANGVVVAKGTFLSQASDRHQERWK